MMATTLCVKSWEPCSSDNGSIAGLVLSIIIYYGILWSVRVYCGLITVYYRITTVHRALLWSYYGLQIYRQMCLQKYLQIYLLIYLQMYLQTYLQLDLQMYLQMYLQIYLHIHIYIRRYT